MVDRADKMISENIWDNLRRCIREREKAAVGFTVRTEINGHFLELTGIPDERIASEKIQKAITEANNYNARSFFGKIIITEGLNQVCFRIQYVLPDALYKAVDITAGALTAAGNTAATAGEIVEAAENTAEAAAIGEALAEYMFQQMDNMAQWISELNASDNSGNGSGRFGSRPTAIFGIRDKLFKPCEVYERLRDTLDRYQVRYEAVSNCMEVCCEWCGMEASDRFSERRQTYTVSVNPRQGMVQFLAALSVDVPEAEREKALQYCMVLNRQVWGQFYINMAAGSVYYYLTTPYHNGPVAPDWIARQIAAAEHAIGICRKNEV